VLDLLIAHAYDARTTQGEPTVESAWTVRVLSPTLSWLDAFHTPRDTAVACFHRMLAYPYLRHASLACAALDDAAAVLARGRRCALRCLLRVHRTLQRSEQLYLLNRLYLDDMIVWLQQCQDRTFTLFAGAATTQLRELQADPFSWARWGLDALVARALEHDDEHEHDG
jgi:protein SHQ1